MVELLLLSAATGVLGFLVAIYFFFYRLQVHPILRWLGGIVGGLFLGVIMAALALVIFIPPAVDYVTAGGIGLMVIVLMLLLDIPKASVSEKLLGRFKAVRKSAMLGAAEPTIGEENN